MGKKERHFFLLLEFEAKPLPQKRSLIITRTPAPLSFELGAGKASARGARRASVQCLGRRVAVRLEGVHIKGVLGETSGFHMCHGQDTPNESAWFRGSLMGGTPD